MSDSFTGEIQMFAGSFAPRGWAFCDGQILNKTEYEALYSLIGTTYGGDGVTTFGLPDLRGRVPVHFGQGAGLTARNLGEKGGLEHVGVTSDELPVHTHSWQAYSGSAASDTPVAGSLANTASNYYTTRTDNVLDMSDDMIGSAGSSQQHNNMMPTGFVHFIICLIGVYPSRS